MEVLTPMVMPMVMQMLTVMLMQTEKNHPLVEAEEEAGAEGEDEGVDGAVAAVAVAEADTTTATTTTTKSIFFSFFFFSPYQPKRIPTHQISVVSFSFLSLSWALQWLKNSIRYQTLYQVL
mmetsp:Transcript_25669/g.39325  ORF Transcript_25669/g.39325 Transcript_25669/m.39325 type:complete len:121 (-) Transcript_25669:474-836(-)